MHSVLISLASNSEQEENLSEARKALAQVLLSPVYTPAIWTEPYGKSRTANPQKYLNQLVSAETCLDADELNSRLKAIEQAQGRNDEARQQGIVPIDLDLANVTYVASAGLRVLVSADKLAVTRGGHLRLLHPCDDVMQVFEMTGLSEVFAIER